MFFHWRVEWYCCIVNRYIGFSQISTVLCAEHCNRNQDSAKNRERFRLSLKVCWEKQKIEALTWARWTLSCLWFRSHSTMPLLHLELYCQTVRGNLWKYFSQEFFHWQHCFSWNRQSVFSLQFIEYDVRVKCFFFVVCFTMEQFLSKCPCVQHNSQCSLLGVIIFP